MGKLTRQRISVLNWSRTWSVLRSIPATNTDQMLQIPSVSAIPQVQGLRGRSPRRRPSWRRRKKRYLPQHPKTIQAVTQLEPVEGALFRTL